MTIQTPEFEGTEESEHVWKDEVSKEVSKLLTDMAALTARVAANEELLNTEAEAPDFEKVVFNTTSTSIAPFTNDYPMGIVVCYVTVTATAATGNLRLHITTVETGTLRTDKGFNEYFVGPEGDYLGTVSAGYSQDELIDGTVTVESTNVSNASFTVRRWEVIRFRKED